MTALLDVLDVLDGATAGSVRAALPAELAVRAATRRAAGGLRSRARPAAGPAALGLGFYGVAAIRSGSRCATSGVPRPVTASQPVEAL